MCVTQPNGENNTNVMFRFAQSSVASTSAGVWSMFGPTGASNYILDGHSANTSSTTISDIRYCMVDNYTGVMYRREARSGVVEAPSGHSNFTAKLLYVDP